VNIDLSEIEIGPLGDGSDEFCTSLRLVLERIAPLAATTPGLAADERVRRLCAAVNLVLDTLQELTGMANLELVPDLIERISELAVTGDNVEVQISVAGDLRIDKRNRLIVDELLVACQRIPAPQRPAALRQAVSSMQRLLALLLLHGWTDGMTDDATRQAARRAIVDTVQGHLYAGEPALSATPQATSQATPQSSARRPHA